MSPKYKLMYFDIKALAEPIRFLFAYAKVEFEDVRVARDDWPNMKPQMPWNKMPVLEEDGKQLSQSVTIFRYLGRKFGLGGKDEFSTAKCDEYVDAMVDLRQGLFNAFREPEEKKAELKNTFKTETLPHILKKFEDILKKNGSGFLVGNSLTYADIFVGFMGQYLSEVVGFKSYDELPSVEEHQKKILALPGIKEWIAKRPATEF